MATRAASALCISIIAAPFHFNISVLVDVSSFILMYSTQQQSDKGFKENPHSFITTFEKAKAHLSLEG